MTFFPWGTKTEELRRIIHRNLAETLSSAQHIDKRANQSKLAFTPRMWHLGNHKMRRTTTTQQRANQQRLTFDQLATEKDDKRFKEP